MKFPTCRKAAFALPLLLLGAQSASATSLNGTFVHDNDLQFFTFTLSSATNTSIASSSFGFGGFVPWLAIWDATGQFVVSDATSGSADASISQSFSAGTYYGALFVSNNSFNGPDMPGAGPATNFADVYDPARFSHNGFQDTDDQFLFNQFNASCGPGVTGYFVYDIGGCANRSGDWALDITASAPTALSGVGLYPASASTVPEPGTLALALAGLAGFASSARRRNA